MKDYVKLAGLDKPAKPRLYQSRETGSWFIRCGNGNVNHLEGPFASWNKALAYLLATPPGHTKPASARQILRAARIKCGGMLRQCQ